MTDHDLPSELPTLMAEFARSGLMTLHVRHAEFEILLSNDPDVDSVQHASALNAAPAQVKSAPVPIAPPANAASASTTSTDNLPADAVIICAPNLGTFYRAPKPGADDYVQIGSTVMSGQELCLIEVMKLFTAVRSEHAGRVHAVLAVDGAMVEAGQPLFALVSN